MAVPSNRLTSESVCSHTKQQLSGKREERGYRHEQINNEGVTVHLDGNSVTMSSGIYRDKGIEKGKPSSRRGALYQRLAESKRRVGMHRHQSTLIAR